MNNLDTNLFEEKDDYEHNNYCSFNKDKVLSIIRSLTAELLCEVRYCLQTGGTVEGEPVHIPVVVLEVESIQNKGVYYQQYIGTAICKDGITRRFKAVIDFCPGYDCEPPSDNSGIYWQEVGWIADAVHFLKRLKALIPQACIHVGPAVLYRKRDGYHNQYHCYDIGRYTFTWPPYNEWRN